MVYKGKNPKPQGGAGAKKCNNCGRNGHLANECRDKKGQQGGAQKCNNCGRNGHLANECRDKKKGNGQQQNTNTKKCTNCNRHGHLANECRDKKKGQQTTKDKTPSRACKHCHEMGHFDSSCPTLVENGGTKTDKFSQAGAWMNEDLPINHSCSVCGMGHQTSECPSRPQQPTNTYIQTTAEFNALLKALNENPGNETDIVNQWRIAYPHLADPQIHQQSQQYVQFQAQAPVINTQPLAVWNNIGESFQNMQIAAPYEETSMTGRSYIPAQVRSVMDYGNFGNVPDSIDRDGDVVMGEWDYLG